MEFSNECRDNNAEEAGGDDGKPDAESDGEALPDDVSPEISDYADDEAGAGTEEDGSEQFFADTRQYAAPGDVSLEEDLEGQGH